ncbi:hypothetical protein BUALT_Bualt03G0050800 [Buddleja alternifolia]|uniref:LOB domain-containing protein n=1 Tax=Buddleja alternifolia TaxID=168488 RepID=A0AAV6XVK0_9LAMI|nr:hypothetical protein BUALT_Bualt03G0050800 [Buddleja alternifolia]
MANKSDNDEQSNHPACAACKYQRKRCKPDCILSRHFPANRSNDFKAVQKIFGVKTLTKMMSEVNSHERDELVNSLYWEAAMWAKDPVRGPYGYYKRVEDELNKYKNQFLQHNMNVVPTIMPVETNNGFIPQPINSISFDGNTMNGSSIMDCRVINGYARGRGSPYPDPAVGQQRMSIQEVHSRFLINQEVERNRTTSSFYSPHVRVQMNNSLSSDQSISNGQWSREQVINGGFGSGSNGSGPNQAIDQGLHMRVKNRVKKANAMEDTIRPFYFVSRMANNSDNEEQSKNHIPACAACKHQRKGCRPDCILRRHFPADRANAFKAVLKIFGVKSLKKMMSEVNPDERDEVEKSIYWEAAMWAQDPVRGPYGCFTRVRDELHKYIYKEQQQSMQQNIMINNNGSGSRGQVNVEGFGSGRSNDRKSAEAGVVLRDDRGVWILGFSLKLGDVSITLAEILAVRKGVVVALDRIVEKLVMEMDSMVVVNLINKADTETHPRTVKEEPAMILKDLSKCGLNLQKKCTAYWKMI